MKTPENLDPERETRAFFWFLTLVLIGMYGFILITQPEMRQPMPWILFTVLMSVHVVLHWMLRVYSERPGWLIIYLIVQGGLAFIITLLTANTGMVYGLYMALVGEAIGVYGITRRGFGAAAYFLLLSFISFLLVTTNVSPFWWLLGVVPVVIFVVIYVELYSRQLMANVRAQELLAELQTANQQLTEYSAQVEDLTIANERQRMARELHDTLSQGLAGLILQLEAVDAHLEGDRPEKAHTILQETMTSARRILSEARRAIDDLRDSAPTDLETALNQETTRFNTATGIICDVSISLPEPFPEELCDPVLRIVSEALTNIAHHAQADHASLDISFTENMLLLSIRDNGCGFNPENIPPGHYGLVGMRERTRLMDGTLKIESEPEQGTNITISLPLTISVD